MKKLAILGLFALAFKYSNGQTKVFRKLDKFEHTIDTVRYNDSSANILRFTSTALMKDIHLTYYEIYNFQKSLESFSRNCNYSYAPPTRTELNEAWLKLGEIKVYANVPIISMYDTELKFYDWVIVVDSLKKERTLFVKDSLLIEFDKKLALKNKADSFYKAEQNDKLRLQAKVSDDKFRKDCIKQFGAKIGNIVAAGNVQIGMTSDMCRYAWGAPDRETTTLMSGVTYVTYYFRDRGYGVLRFRNDKLYSMTK